MEEIEPCLAKLFAAYDAPDTSNDTIADLAFQTVQRCQRHAVDYLRQRSFDEAFTMLREAERVLDEDRSERRVLGMERYGETVAALRRRSIAVLKSFETSRSERGIAGSPQQKKLYHRRGVKQPVPWMAAAEQRAQKRQGRGVLETVPPTPELYTPRRPSGISHSGIAGAHRMKDPIEAMDAQIVEEQQQQRYDEYQSYGAPDNEGEVTQPSAVTASDPAVMKVFRPTPPSGGRSGPVDEVVRRDIQVARNRYIERSGSAKGVPGSRSPSPGSSRDENAAWRNRSADHVARAQRVQDAALASAHETAYRTAERQRVLKAKTKQLESETADQRHAIRQAREKEEAERSKRIAELRQHHAERLEAFEAKKRANLDAKRAALERERKARKAREDYESGADVDIKKRLQLADLIPSGRLLGKVAQEHGGGATVLPGARPVVPTRRSSGSKRSPSPTDELGGRRDSGGGQRGDSTPYVTSRSPSATPNDDVGNNTVSSSEGFANLSGASVVLRHSSPTFGSGDEPIPLGRRQSVGNRSIRSAGTGGGRLSPLRKPRAGSPRSELTESRASVSTGAGTALRNMPKALFASPAKHRLYDEFLDQMKRIDTSQERALAGIAAANNAKRLSLSQHLSGGGSSSITTMPSAHPPQSTVGVSPTPAGSFFHGVPRLSSAGLSQRNPSVAETSISTPGGTTPTQHRSPSRSVTAARPASSSPGLESPMRAEAPDRTAQQAKQFTSIRTGTNVAKVPTPVVGLAATEMDLTKATQWELESNLDLVLGVPRIQRAFRTWKARYMRQQREEAVEAYLTHQLRREEAARQLIPWLRTNVARRRVDAIRRRVAYVTQQRVELERRSEEGGSGFMETTISVTGVEQDRGSFALSSGLSMNSLFGTRRRSQHKRPSDTAAIPQKLAFANPFSAKDKRHGKLKEIQRRIAQRAIAIYWRDFQEYQMMLLQEEALNYAKIVTRKAGPLVPQSSPIGATPGSGFLPQLAEPQGGTWLPPSIDGPDNDGGASAISRGRTPQHLARSFGDWETNSRSMTPQAPMVYKPLVRVSITAQRKEEQRAQAEAEVAERKAEEARHREEEVAIQEKLRRAGQILLLQRVGRGYRRRLHLVAIMMMRMADSSQANEGSTANVASTLSVGVVGVTSSSSFAPSAVPRAGLHIVEAPSTAGKPVSASADAAIMNIIRTTRPDLVPDCVEAKRRAHEAAALTIQRFTQSYLSAFFTRSKVETRAARRIQAAYRRSDRGGASVKTHREDLRADAFLHHGWDGGQ